MRCSVGQVLFVVLNKKNQVYPMLVVEEISKKTLQGVEVNYVLQGGSDPTSTVLLTQVDGEVFETSEDARNTIVDRATAQIDKLISVAVTKSKEWYPSAYNLTAQQPAAFIPDGDVEHAVVHLPDGKIAKIKMADAS